MGRATWLGLAGGLGLAGCTPAPAADPPVALDGCVEIAPPEPVQAPVGEAAALGLTLRNPCEGRYVVDRVSFDDPSGVFATDGPQAPVVTAGGQAELDLRFSAPRRGVFGAIVYVHGADGSRTDIAVEGTATGPELQADRARVHVRDAPVGCPTTERVRLQSVGEAPVRLRDLRVEGPSAWTLAFAPEVPSELEPGEDAHLQVDVRLPTDLPAQAALIVETDHAEALSIPLTATPAPVERRTETWRYAAHLERDVLVAVDRSTGMRERIEALAREVPQVLEAARRWGIDLHLGLVAADNGCVVGEHAFIDTTFSDSAAREAAAEMADLDFSWAPYGSNTERPFLLLEAATSSPNTDPGGCNAALWRDEAELHAVSVTDVSASTRWTHGVDVLLATKDRGSLVRFHAIAAPYPDGCGDSEASAGLYEASVATEGSFHSICDPMEDAVGDLAAALTQLPTELERSTLRLSEPALLDTIEITVDGLALPAGAWTASRDGGTIFIDADRAPGPRAVVEVRYVPAPGCG